MAGRKPTPTKLKILHGNPGKRPLPENEPQPTGITTPPRAPSYLSDAGKREWRRVVRHLSASRIITHVDLAAVEGYCQCYARWRHAEEQIKTTGDIIETTNGNIIQSPWVSMANTVMREMRAWMVELGMTPSSRSRVKTVGETKEDDSLASQLKRAIGE